MNHWPTKTLGEVAEFTNGRPFKPTDWSSAGVPIIRIQNLTDMTAPANRFTGTFDERHAVRDGDLLVSWSATLDAFMWDRGDAVLNQHIFRVVPDSTLVSKTYLFYALKSVLDELRSKTHGATMKHITKGPFERTKIPVPPLKEQERIVKLLDEANEMRKLRAHADGRTEELIPALFHEMFGDPIENPKGYPVRQLQEVCSRITDGTHQPPLFTDKGILFLFVRNIINGSIDFNTEKFITDNTFDELTRRVKPMRGDILYSTVGSYGVAVEVETDRKFAFQRHIGHLKPNRQQIDSGFLTAQLNTPFVKSQADQSARGIAQKTVNLGEICKFKVLVPPLVLQKQFAKRVTEVRELETQQAASRQRGEELYQSMLHRAFSGEL